MPGIESVSHFTVADWPDLRDEIADTSVQEREARNAALQRGITDKVRPAEEHVVVQSERLVDRLTELQKGAEEAAAWLLHVADWGLERSEATLSEWAGYDARVDQYREEFGRLIGNVQHAQEALADPLAHLAQLESRFPALRSPLPDCLQSPAGRP